jgi:hypothetical protein
MRASRPFEARTRGLPPAESQRVSRSPPKRRVLSLSDVVAVGLDTPGPVSAAGQLSARGSTNFVHPQWAGFDIREGMAHRLGLTK